MEDLQDQRCFDKTSLCSGAPLWGAHPPPGGLREILCFQWYGAGDLLQAHHIKVVSSRFLAAKELRALAGRPFGPERRYGMIVRFRGHIFCKPVSGLAIRPWD